MQLTSLDASPGAHSFGRTLLGCSVLAVATALPAQAAGQLELIPDIPVTVVLIGVFVLLVYPLNRLIFQPLFKVMDEREEKIDGARRRADQVQEQAQEALDRYGDSIRVAREETTAERRRQLEVARSELHAVTALAKAEAETNVSRARDELRGSLDEARETLRAGASDLASLAAERILGRSLS
jgi:F-type H+-transporting ATPase subunit b